VAAFFDFGADVLADVEELHISQALDEEKDYTRWQFDISRKASRPSLAS
jgi:hypothetical protein